MAKFVSTSPSEEVLFVAWGKLNKGQSPEKSLIIKEGEKLIGKLKAVKDSQTYGKIYVLEVKGQKLPVLITGKTNLNDQMGYGEAVTAITPQPGNTVQITFKGITKTAKGRDFYQFEVGVAE